YTTLFRSGRQVDQAVVVEVRAERAVDPGLWAAGTPGAVRHDVDLVEDHAAGRRLDEELEGVSRAAQRRRVGGLHVVRHVHAHALARRERLGRLEAHRL